jgi:hypothetical protein
MQKGWRKGYELIWVRSDWTEPFIDETELTIVVIIVVSFLVRPETTPPTTGTESTVFVTSGITFPRAGRLSTTGRDFLVRDEVRSPTTGTESTVFSTVGTTLLTTGRLPTTGRVFLVSDEVRPPTTGTESTVLVTSDATFPTTGRSPTTGSVRFVTDESVPVILDGMDKTSPFTPLIVDTTSMSRFPNGMARAEEPKVRTVKVVLNFMMTTGKTLQKLC